MQRRRDQLQDYLDGNSDVSRAYRRLQHLKAPGGAPLGGTPPAGVEQKISEYARAALAADAEQKAPPRMRNINKPVVRRPSWFAPFSLAASVLLSAAVLLAIAFDPHAHHSKEDKVRIVPAVAQREIAHRQLYSSDPPHSRALSTDGAVLPPMPVEVLHKDPVEWLARIKALRQSGRTRAADAELREFRKVFPRYSEPGLQNAAR